MKSVKGGVHRRVAGMAHLHRADLLTLRRSQALTLRLIVLILIGMGPLQAEDLGCESDDACSLGYCVFSVGGEGGGVCVLHEAPLEGLPGKSSQATDPGVLKGPKRCTYAVDCSFGEACYAKNPLSAGGRCLPVPLETAP